MKPWPAILRSVELLPPSGCISLLLNTNVPNVFLHGSVKKKEKWKYTKIKYFLFEGNVCILYVQQRYLSNVLSTGKEICQHVKSSLLFNFDQSFCVAVTTCFCAVKKVVFKCFKHCSAGPLNSTILICFCFLLSLSYGFQLVSVLFNCCFTFFFLYVMLQ